MGRKRDKNDEFSTKHVIMTPHLISLANDKITVTPFDQPNQTAPNGR